MCSGLGVNVAGAEAAATDQSHAVDLHPQPLCDVEAWVKPHRVGHDTGLYADVGVALAYPGHRFEQGADQRPVGNVGNDGLRKRGIGEVRAAHPESQVRGDGILDIQTLADHAGFARNHSEVNGFGRHRITGRGLAVLIVVSVIGAIDEDRRGRDHPAGGLLALPRHRTSMPSHRPSWVCSGPSTTAQRRVRRAGTRLE